MFEKEIPLPDGQLECQMASARIDEDIATGHVQRRTPRRQLHRLSNHDRKQANNDWRTAQRSMASRLMYATPFGHRY
jgi:hypothetical protein